jgi:hypothetical protein
MPLTSYLLKLLGLSQAIASWKTALESLEATRRKKIARYADAIAATFARAAAAFALLEQDATDTRAQREAIRELGRIAGYMEDIVAALEDHLDGRKLAGVKRRLDALADPQAPSAVVLARDTTRIAKLVEAEGYFRALADGLRA